MVGLSDHAVVPPALDTGDAVLAASGLRITEQQAPSGESRYCVTGDTHSHRHLLRALGGAWDRLRQHWVFVGADPRAGLAAAIADDGAAAGLEDSAPPPELVNRPSYWGHRQRLRDRFLAGGDEALPDYELLELLLFFAVPRIDTKPLAKDLLRDFRSLGGVLHASAERLADYPQVNHHTLALFKAVRALAGRIAREEAADGTVLTRWDQLMAYLRATMAHRAVEQFRVLFLDRRNVLIADEVQHQGSIDHTPVYPREVVKRALTLDASAVIMVHNHPSNHPKPSSGDIEMTQVVRQALAAVGVVLHDHVVVSKKGHTSFRQAGLL
jgi:DNA repair protein RadC